MLAVAPAETPSSSEVAVAEVVGELMASMQPSKLAEVSSDTEAPSSFVEGGKNPSSFEALEQCVLHPLLLLELLSTFCFTMPHLVAIPTCACELGC